MENCTKCETEVAPTAKFCGECGTKIECKKYCLECGTEVKPEQKFCTECGARLIESETPAPQPKTEPEQSKAVTAEDKIQKICNDIKASLEKLEMPEFVWFGNDFDGHYYGEDPILPEDVDIWELLDETLSDMYGELRGGVRQTPQENCKTEIGRKYNQMGVAKKKISRSFFIFYMPQSGIERRVENIFARFIEIFGPTFYFFLVKNRDFSGIFGGFNFIDNYLEMNKII